MKEFDLESFYEDNECTQLKKSCSTDFKKLSFEDFDLDGWTFVGFKEATETNIPSNMKYDVEPERYYVLDFYPIGEETYTLCVKYDPDEKTDCRFTNGRRIYQVKVSEAFLNNFIKNNLYNGLSLKSIIEDEITNDEFYNQNWHSMPFKLFDDRSDYGKRLQTAMKKRIKKEIKNENLTTQKAEHMFKCFEDLTKRKLELLDIYYTLNPGKATESYKAMLLERSMTTKKPTKAKKKYVKKSDGLPVENENFAEEKPAKTKETLQKHKQ